MKMANAPAHEVEAIWYTIVYWHWISEKNRYQFLH
jgi:hypothetical protein